MTKNKILEVASIEFSKYGYDAVSMNNLVKKLDINKATVYYHYKDKKTLYSEVVKDAVSSINNKNREILKKNLDPIESFNLYLRNEVAAIIEKPFMPSLALREIANLGADLDDSVIPHIQEEVMILKEILNKLDLKDEYKSISEYAFLSLILGTINNFYSFQMSELKIGTDDHLKGNASESLDYIANFISSILLTSICK